MAEQYSSAVLGLGIDTKQFNKELDSTSLRVQANLEKMKRYADAFGDKWEGLTAGIKDTKRIVSGILISQGFYAILDTLTTAASAALSFAKNMETAAISMEYFVEGADKANKAAAFLREMNTFAAKTPFTTEGALAFSTYMQAVGVSMNSTKSFLQVITDTAAATGATEENLQRVIFGLGQMMTKGRLAGEEIRQLANANIPIYEILREELNLTGEQISNIGKHWIDADKAVVAILDGLEKRYAGAADRISNTVTGMTDTIVDDLKIIAQSAGSGLYESLSSNMTTLRDALDNYRDIAVTQGSGGLFNQILVDLDATGAIGNEILALLGNIRQLGGALGSLYAAGKPLISLFGKGLYASLSTATITLTGLARTADGLVGILNRLGITTGTTAQVISSLIIAYKAASWMGTLGQAAVTATYNLAQTALSMGNLLPAALRANTGVAVLTAGLAGLVTMGLAAAGVFSMLNNTTAGLEVSGGGFSQDYLDSMAKYEAEMAEYNAAIARYQDSFNQPYSTIEDGTNKAIDGLENVEKASKKAAGSVKRDWVAAFDEVYSIPDDASGGGAGGIGSDITLPDLGALLTLPKFVFPELAVEQLKMPEFSLADVWEGSPFSDMPDKNWLAAILPGLITGAAVGVGKLFAKKRETDIAAKANKDASDPTTSTKASVTDDVETLIKKLLKEDEDSQSLLKKLADTSDKTLEAIKRDQIYGTAGPDATRIGGYSAQLKLGQKELVKITNGINELRAALGLAPIELMEEAAVREAIRQGDFTVIKKQLMSIGSQLKKSGLSLVEIEALQEKQTKLLAALNKLDSIMPASKIDVGSLGYKELELLFDKQANKVIKTFDAAFTGATSKAVGGTRYYETALIKEANEAWQDFIYLADRMNLFAEHAQPSDTVGNNVLTALTGFRDKIDLVFRKLLNEGMGVADRLEQVARGLLRRDTTVIPAGIREELFALSKETSEQVDFLRAMNNLLVTYSAETLAADKEREEKRKKYEEEALVQREEQLALQKKAEAQQKAERKERIKAQTDRQVFGADPKLNAQYQDNLYRIAKKDEENGIRYIDIAEDNNEEIKKLRKELNKVRKDIVEKQFYVDSGRADKKYKGLPEYALPKKMIEAIQDIRNQKLYLSGIADNLIVLGAKVPSAVFELIGKQQTMIQVIADNGQLAKKALSEAVRASLQPGNLPTRSADALYLAKISLPKALQDVSEAAQIAASKFMLSGTRTEIAAKGLSSFGDDLLTLVAKTYNEAGISVLDSLLGAPASPRVRASASLGTWLEDFVKSIAAQKMVPEFGSISAGGFQAVPGTPIIVEIDSQMHIWDALGIHKESISNDIKTKTAAAFQELYDGSADFAAGIRVLLAEVLKRDAPGLYAQFILQAYATGNNKVGLSAFNRDFDYTEVEPDLVNYWKKLMNRSDLTSAIGGRIFSVDALLEYGKLNNMASDEVDEKYINNILVPLLTKQGKVDFSPLQHAFQQYIVEFTDEAIKAFQPKKLANAYLQYNRLIATVIDNPNIAEFLHAYIRLNEEAGSVIGSLNFSPALRTYSKMTGKHNKWLQNILGTDESFTRAAIKKPLQREIDRIVIEYNTAVSKAANLDEAAAIAEKFSKQLDELSRMAKIYGDGGKLDEAFVKIFEGSKRSIRDMELIQRALNKLANKVDMINRLPIKTRTLIDGVRRINNKLATGAEIHAEELMGISKTTEEVFDLLGATTTKAADVFATQISDMQQIAFRAVGKLSAFNPAVYPQLELPFEVLGIADTLALQALEIKDGVEKGLLTVSEGMADEFEAVMSEIDVKPMAKNFIGQFKKTAENVYSRFFFDIETKGQIEATQQGKEYPAGVQVALFDDETKTAYSWFVDYEELNQETVNYMASILESWQDIPAEMLATGRSFVSILEEVRDIVGDNYVATYNGSNYGVPGGAFDMRIVRAIMGEGFLKLGSDVMTMVTDVVAKYTGTRTRFKLSDVYEMITGGAAEGAHMAETDVMMTASVQQAIRDGSFEQIVRTAVENGAENGIKNALLEAGREAAAPIIPATMRPGGPIAGTTADRLPEYLYHVTPVNHLDSIMKTGLYADSFVTIADETEEGFKRIIGAANGFSDASSLARDGLALLRISTKELTEGTELIGAQLDTLVPPGAIENLGKLSEAGSSFKGLAGNIDEVAEVASTASKAIDEVATEAAKTATEAAKTTTESAKTVFEEATETASKASFKFGEKIKTFWARMNDGWGGVGKAAKTIDEGINLFDSFDDLVVAAQKFAPFQVEFNKAKAAMEAGLATPKTSWVKEATDAYNKAHTDYSKVSKTFYKDIIDATTVGLKDFENTGTMFKVASDLFDEGTGYLAYSLNPKTGALKLLNDSLFSTGDELQQLFLKTATKAAEGLKLSDEAIGLAFDEFLLYTKGLKAADELSEAAKIFRKTFEDMSNVTVIMDAAGNVRFAGAAASNAIEAAADALSLSFKSVSQKLIAGVAGFGLFDVIGIVTSGIFQAIADKSQEALFNQKLQFFDDTGLITELDKAGINIGKIIGDSIYNGVWQVMGQEAFSAAIGGFVTTGLAAIPGLNIAAIVAAAIGSLASVGTDSVLKTMGARTDTNLYLDDYLRLLEKGNLISEEHFIEMENLLGRQLTATEKSVIERAGRDQQNFQLYTNAKNNPFERDDINNILFGKNNRVDYIDSLTSSGGEAALVLRLAQILGVADFTGEESSYGTYLQQGFGTQVSTSYLTVKDEAALKELEKILGVNLEMEKISKRNDFRVKDTSTGRYLEAVDNVGLTNLQELLHAMYIQGIGSGSLAETLEQVLKNNPTISKATAETFGKAAYMAYENFDAILDAYNRANKTNYTREHADSIEGFSQQRMEQAVKTYETFNSIWLARETERGDLETVNRNILSGDTSSIVWDSSLAGTTEEIIKELAAFGLSLSEGSIQVDTALAGMLEMTYVQLDTSAEALKDNLAGWTLDLSSYEGLDLKQLTLSAEAVEILASAGIQINSDGTVDFMRTINEEVTGAERKFEGERGSYAANRLTELESGGIKLDFEAGEIDLTGMIDKIRESATGNISGALFKLPTNILTDLPDNARTALEGLGNIMSSGYINITNEAILGGSQTIEGYLAGLTGGLDEFNDDAKKAFKNIDKVLQHGGQTVAQNIIDWSDGIVIKSPWAKGTVSEDMEADFAAMGLRFEELAGEYVIVVNAAGEKLKNGVTKIDAASWLNLVETEEGFTSLGRMLKDAGVDWEVVANQAFVDLSGTFENGVFDVVALFTETPEIWNQIPEAIKNTLIQLGVISEEELIKLDLIMLGGLTPIADGWVATWESLDKPLQTALARAGLSAENGFFKIVELTEGAAIPEALEGEIIIPFSELDPEIMGMLDALGVDLEDKNGYLTTATATALAGMVSTLSTTSSELQNEASQMAMAIATAVSDAFADIQRLESMRANAGRSGFFWKDQNQVGQKPYVNIRGVDYYAEYKANGDIAAYQYFDTKTGTYKRVTSLPSRAEGGGTEGPTLVGEKGREIAIYPNGQMRFVGSGGAELINFPAGTEIVNNEDSENIAKYTSPSRMFIKGYASGTTSVSAPPSFDTTDWRSLTNIITTNINNSYAAGQRSWDKARKDGALPAPQLLSGSMDGWESFVDTIETNVVNAFDIGNETWQRDTQENQLRAYLLNQGSWMQLPVTISANVTSSGRQGTQTWEQYVATNQLVALLLKQGQDNGGWDSIGPQAASKVEAAGTASMGAWENYRNANPLQALKVEESTWKLLEDTSVRYMQSIIKAMQDALDKASLKATVSITGAISIGGGSGGYDNMLYGTGGGLVNNFLNGVGYITSPFGMRVQPVSKVTRMHHGVDIAAYSGTPIKAGIAGVVRRGYDPAGYGNYVDVVAADGTFTRLAHMSAFNSAYPTDATVAAGNIVGYVGSTGNSTGPHLHIEYHPGGGGAVDPSGYFYASGGDAAGLVMAAEKGRELVVLPDGSIQLLSDAALYNLPEGSHVINNSDTEKMLRYSGGINRLKEVRALEDGNATIELPSEENSEFKTTFTAFMKAFIELYGFNEEGTTKIGSRDTTNYIVENVHVAIRGAVAALLEGLATDGNKLQTALDSYFSTITSTLNQNTVDIKSAVQSLSSSITSTRSSSSSPTVDKSFKDLSEIIEEAKKEWLAASTDAEREAAHAKAEAARAKLGYSGGADGSSYIALIGITDTEKIMAKLPYSKFEEISASAYGSIVTDDQLVRVSEFGKREAIIPLEQPSVMAQLGAAIGDYIGISIDASMLQENFDHLVENIHVAIRGAVGALSEQSNKRDLNLHTYFTDLATELKTSFDASIIKAASDVSSAISSSLSSSRYTTNDTKIVKESAESVAEKLIAEAKKEWAVAESDAEREAAHAKAEAARATLGYSGGTDGSGYILLDTKNITAKLPYHKFEEIPESAYGSMVTGDQLVRVGEFGLNEAIIPLERPSVLAKVGTAIARSMPVEQAQLLNSAIGRQNAGIILPAPQPMYPMQQQASTDAIVQSVLEAVLPAMATTDDEPNKQNLNVGVLIADEQGLKMLERKLYTIRQSESTRRL